jgi:hypothetical protein
MANTTIDTPAPGGKHDETGPAQALSVLYEANDLLNIFRSHSGDSLHQKLTSGEWTLTCEIKRRLDAAIAHLDGGVSHSADRPEDIVPDSVQGSVVPDLAQPTGLQRGQYALLIGDDIDNVVSGIRGIADTLEGPIFDDIEDENVQRLVMALQQLALRLYDAAYNIPSDTIDKVSVVLESPDSRIEAMTKRLRDKKLHLWSDPKTPNIFGVSDGHGNMKMSICSLCEIEHNLLAD